MIRRIVFIAAFVATAAGVAGAPAVADDTSAVIAPIATYVRAANAGDEAKIVGAFTRDSEIVDEFAPYRFPAPHAAQHWLRGFATDMKANGVTDPLIKTTTPKFVQVTGTHAWVVVPTVFTYKLKGKPAKETGMLVFALLKADATWKIGTMAWAKLTDTSQP